MMMDEEGLEGGLSCAHVSSERPSSAMSLISHSKRLALNDA
jgi:hypothetical protein